MGRERDKVEDLLDVVLAEPGLGEAVGRVVAHHPCAHGQALIPVASTPTTRRVPPGGSGDPDQRDHLLRRQSETGVPRAIG